MWDDSFMFKLREQNFQVKLKIGKIDRFITQSCSAQHRLARKDLMVDTNPSGSTKRITSPGGTQTASCSVDGCSSDLSKYKLYHRRHRVCVRHSKAPLVIVRGQKKRFCQQCSRFHPLEEFDEVKRSCRKRLAGHNKRRRKPRPGSFGISESTIRFLQFGAPQIPAATSTAISYQNQLSRGDSNTFSWTYNGKYEWFPFAEPKGHQSSQVAVATGDSFCPPGLQSILSSENERCGHESDGNTQSINSNSALCLLSMNSIPTAGTGLSHFMQSEVINPVSPQRSEMQVNSVSMLSPILLPGIGESSAGCNGIFHLRPDSLLDHGMRSTITGL